MSDTSNIIGKVGAEGCIEWEEGHQGSGEGSGNPTWESSFPGRGDRTELLLEVGEMKRPRVVRPWVKVPMGQSQSYGPQRVGQPEELMSHLGSQGPMNMSFTIGYLPLRPTSATQDSPKAKAGRYSQPASLVQIQGLLPEDKASLLLHRHHILGQVVGM